MASLSVLSLAGRDFGCSWQQGLAQEASLADEGRVPCEAALQFDKGKTEAVLPYKECSVEMTVTLQTVTCQFQVDPYQGVQTMADSSVTECLFPQVYSAVILISVHRAPSAPTRFQPPPHDLHYHYKTWPLASGRLMEIPDPLTPCYTRSL